MVGFDTPQYVGSIAFTGIIGINQSGLDLGERTLHHISLNVGAKLGQIQPELFIKIPLDDEVNDMISRSLGIKISYSPSIG